MKYKILFLLILPIAIAITFAAEEAKEIRDVWIYNFSKYGFN